MRQMRFFRGGWVAFLFIIIAGCQKPDFNAIDGQKINLKDSQGRWLALNIWAEWCDPCREEIPHLNSLSGKGEIRVVGYDFDEEKGQPLKDKVKSMAIAFPVIEENPLPLLGVKSPQVLPATYIINPEGKLVDTLYGPQTGESIKGYISEQQQKVKAGG
ncbi:TlpA family protein disulfide reductase [Endozoicomonas sp. Mp262]|uniref:TlpA family protein disulfide reductase n=1 Tax=Endozoicomonas sp. Mp262 TaxID=2919499 RepID=UPI0021D7EA73